MCRLLILRVAVVHNDLQVVEDVRVYHIPLHVSARVETLRTVNHTVKVEHGLHIYLDYDHGC
jgi:hypothetical protein